MPTPWHSNGTFHNAENNGPPRGLSMFFAVPAPIFGGTSSMSTEELDLRIKGNLLTPALIMKLTASQVQIPKDKHGFRATLENHLCAIDFAFTKESVLYKQLNTIFNATSKHKRNFGTMIANNTDYIACLMQAIDIKSQIFFESCASAKVIDDVNFAALDFSDEINSFIFQKGLGISLPPAIKQIVDAISSPPATNKQEGKRKPSPYDLDAKNKRKKEAGAVGGPTVKNKSPVDPSWIKPGENLGPFHKGEKPPLLKGKEICLKYHLLGYCTFGPTCQRKDSHTDAFDEGAKAAFSKWVNKCRSGAGN